MIETATQRRTGIVLILAAAVAWSTAPFFTRLLALLDSWTILFWRGLSGAAVITVVLVLTQGRAGLRDFTGMGRSGWLVASLDARLRLIRDHEEWLPPVRVRNTRTVADRRAYRDLVIMLATEIYRRERGAPPPTEDALIGTYLQSLPDDGSAELADGTTPTVE